MSAFKFLIDTNVVIGLEDNRPVDVGLTELVRRCSANGVRLFVDAAVDDDVKRDMDLARRAVTLSKLEKFERLKGVVYPDDAELARRCGPINSVNDRSDCRLLFCLERRAAEFLITRDTGLRRRARRIGLGDSVVSVEDAVVWLRQTFEPTTVELPYVVERAAYAVDKRDALFDGLRADYAGFDPWFDKCAKEHRKCWVVEVAGSLAGIVIRKDETRTEAKGVKSPGERILKLCTFIMGALREVGRAAAEAMPMVRAGQRLRRSLRDGLPQQRRAHLPLRGVRVHGHRAPRQWGAGAGKGAP
jgi:rRNA-processing protein FCF1